MSKLIVIVQTAVVVNLKDKKNEDAEVSLLEIAGGSAAKAMRLTHDQIRQWAVETLFDEQAKKYEGTGIHIRVGVKYEGVVLQKEGVIE